MYIPQIVIGLILGFIAGIVATFIFLALINKKFNKDA